LLSLCAGGVFYDNDKQYRIVSCLTHHNVPSGSRKSSIVAIGKPFGYLFLRLSRFASAGIDQVPIKVFFI
jgi:hypothetical protein